MMKITEAKQMFVDLCKKMNVELICPVEVNARLTRTLGRVKYDYNIYKEIYIPCAVEFSKKHLEQAPDEEIKDTIIHEFVHYYLAMIDPQIRHGHDVVFKEYCVKLGCAPRAKSTMEVDYTKDKYTIYCSECGKPVGGRARACKVTKYPEMYRSTCCHAPLRVTQNW